VELSWTVASGDPVLVDIVCASRSGFVGCPSGNGIDREDGVEA